MFSALLYTLLVTGDPCSRCCNAAPQTPVLSREIGQHVGYYKRLYLGHFDRQPFDYRFQYDYPWHAGPSQQQWPLAAPLHAAHTGQINLAPGFVPDSPACPYVDIVSLKRLSAASPGTPGPASRVRRATAPSRLAR